MALKPNLLFLTPRLPYPPIGGEKSKGYNLIKCLSKHCSIHLVSFDSTTPSEETLAFLGEHTASWKILRRSLTVGALGALKAIPTSTPLQVGYYRHSGFRKTVNELLPSMDAAICSTVRTAGYLIDKNIPKIVDFTDSIALNYQRSIALTSSPFWKTIFRIEAPRLLAFERDCIEAFDRSIFVNKQEMDYFERPDKTRWIPIGVKETLFDLPIVPAKEPSVAFMGLMNYPPNIDAVLYFCERVLPILQGKVKFYIIGPNPPPQIRALSKVHPEVVVTGFVQDPFKILTTCTAVVAPMQTGGGIQTKSLEAMAVGQIVVTSTLAAAPIIGAEHGRHFLVADTPEGYASHILDLLRSPLAFIPMRLAARDFVHSNFTLELVECRYLKEIRELIV